MNDFRLELQLMDYIGFGIWFILFVNYLVSFFKDLHYFSEIDPLPKKKE